MWDVTTPVYSWILIEIVLGLGLGGNFQNMLIAIQATIHHSDIAVATATFSFVALLGSTLGIAIGGTVFQNQMTSLAGDLPDVPGLAALTGENAGAAVASVQGLPEGVKGIVLGNYAESLRMVWIVLSAFAGAGFLASFAIGSHELHKECGCLWKRGLIVVFARISLLGWRRNDIQLLLSMGPTWMKVLSREKFEFVVGRFA